MLSGGTLGDIFGRKRFFMIGLSSSRPARCSVVWRPRLSVLIAGRAVQGLGAAALLPGTLSILTNTFHDPRERAQAIGIWAGISGLALALGPLVGGALVDRFGWQSVFFLNVPIGVVALVVALLAVRESRHPEGRRLDLPGQAARDRRPGLADLRPDRGQQLTAGPRRRSSACSSRRRSAGAAFLWVEVRSTSPMLQLTFFRNPHLCRGLQLRRRSSASACSACSSS